MVLAAPHAKQIARLTPLRVVSHQAHLELNAPASASETALLRDEVTQLAKAMNVFAEAVVEQLAAQAAELDALRGRLERGLTKPPRAKKPAAIPSFLPPSRTLS